MKTKGNFLSYIASEKKQRKQEVKAPASSSSSNDYSRSRHNVNSMMEFKNETVSYQIS
jgi:hypothetical protein